jgi:hypothetical protein
MEISSVSISFGPGTSSVSESADRRRFRVTHDLRSLEAGETNWASINHVKAADKKRQAAIAAAMNGS